MRILLVNKFHYLRGGAERAYFDTARILEDHGHEVAVFSMHHPDNRETPWSRYFVETVDYSLQYSIFERFRLAKNMIWNSRAARNMEALLDEFQPDVVHLHNIYHQISPSIIPVIKRRGIPIVMTLHDYKLICPNYSMFVRGAVWEGGSLACVRDRCVRDALLPSMVCGIERIVHRSLSVYEKIELFLSPSQFLKEKFLSSGFYGRIEVVGQPIDLASQPVAPEAVLPGLEPQHEHRPFALQVHRPQAAVTRGKFQPSGVAGAMDRHHVLAVFAREQAVDIAQLVVGHQFAKVRVNPAKLEHPAFSGGA